MLNCPMLQWSWLLRYGTYRAGAPCTQHSAGQTRALPSESLCPALAQGKQQKIHTLQITHSSFYMPNSLVFEEQPFSCLVPISWLDRWSQRRWDLFMHFIHYINTFGQLTQVDQWGKHCFRATEQTAMFSSTTKLEKPDVLRWLSNIEFIPDQRP